MQQSEDQFGYEVAARALGRGADANRFLDTLFFALMTVQAAIYAVIPDKLNEYRVVGLGLLFGGFVVAMVGTSFSLFVCDGPDPESFAESFPDDPERTRSRYIDEFIKKANLNERLRAMKMIALWLSLILTVFVLAAVAAGRTAGTGEILR